MGIVAILWVEMLNWEERQKIVLGAGNALYLQLDDDYMDVYVCKYSLSCTLKILMQYFAACKL